ncbi:hydrolase [Clostridium zeae]|uniref:Hydrolase n=1 Tax=Clostridium zeae TaxID=2759022 RepID=A0ABQ1EAI0_9CLOT|nr:carbon-nitrogen hydrolase family protein [Clostridium zeae]GFZ31650.1 hydrolase [Clostridium zeae]
MTKIFRIAIVQETRDPYNMTLNTNKGLSAVKKAKELGADLVLFPECWITGYEFPNVDKNLSTKEIMKTIEFEEWNNLAIDENSEHIQTFCKAAKLLNIGIVITAYTKGIKKPQNSAFVINRSGEIIMKYSKVHTCDFADERMLESGDEFKVCEFEGVKLGVMICYDREYPESARILMLKGAELILVPNDCESMKPRIQALSTRAYENMVGVAMSNPPRKNAGCSCAFSPITWDEDGIPIDNIITLADAETEDVFLAEFDLEKIRTYRNREMMGNTFRKVRAYSELLNDTIKEPFKR